MHIDWFIVLVLIIGLVLGGWGLWLSGRGQDDKRPGDHEKTEKSTSH